VRSRAFRPEAPGCLDDRSLLSGVAGLSADPVVLPMRRLLFVQDQIREAFVLFARHIEPVDASRNESPGDDIPHLLDEIHYLGRMIPFGQVDGLGVASTRIVGNMRHDLAAHVPHAILSARNEVLAVFRADVEARVRAGDVVVR
jgi:hypothetical protein